MSNIKEEKIRDNHYRLTINCIDFEGDKTEIDIKDNSVYIDKEYSIIIKTDKQTAIELFEKALKILKDE